jgi:4-hydroxybenzoate polyprenyltransferase
MMTPADKQARRAHWRDRARQYALLMRFDKPIGIFLLLWPTLWALWIASSGRPDPLVFTVFVLGVVLMRSAGCVMNDYADRGFDPHVARTRDRPIAAGRVSPREALMLCAGLCVAAFLLVLLTNQLTVQLSLVAVALAVSYPYMKRFTYLPQVHLGLAFGWAVPMAFAAQTGELPPREAWLLLVATVLWATAYDTMYAMVDRDDDIRVGVKSTAILFGTSDRLMIGILQLLLMGVLLIVGHRLELSWAYYTGLAVAAGFGLYQQYLIRQRLPADCFRAFLNNNWFGMAIYIGLVVHYLFVAGGG